MLLLFLLVLLESMFLQNWKKKIRAITSCICISVFVWRDVQVNNKPAWGHRARQRQTLEKEKKKFFSFFNPNHSHKAFHHFTFFSSPPWISPTPAASTEPYLKAELGLDSDPLWHIFCLVLEIAALNCNLSPVWGHTLWVTSTSRWFTGSPWKLSQLTVIISISLVPYSI